MGPLFLRAEALEGFADAVRQTLGLDVIIRLPIISVIPLLVFHLAGFKDYLWLAHFAISAPKNAKGLFSDTANTLRSSDIIVQTAIKYVYNR